MNEEIWAGLHVFEKEACTGVIMDIAGRVYCFEEVCISPDFNMRIIDIRDAQK